MYDSPAGYLAASAAAGVGASALGFTVDLAWLVIGGALLLTAAAVCTARWYGKRKEIL